MIRTGSTSCSRCGPRPASRPRSARSGAARASCRSPWPTTSAPRPRSTRSSRSPASARRRSAVGAAQRRDWGGYTGYFADPDGFRWEIATNPGPIGELVLAGADPGEPHQRRAGGHVRWRRCPRRRRDRSGPQIFLVLLALVGVRRASSAACRAPRRRSVTAPRPAPDSATRPVPRMRRAEPRSRVPPPGDSSPAAGGPGGDARAARRRATACSRAQRFLVAYYGTAGTGALGVLGEAEPGLGSCPGCERAAAPFAARRPEGAAGLRADRDRSRAGRRAAGTTYSSDIRAGSGAALPRRRAPVRRRCSVLDLQPGRANFLTGGADAGPGRSATPGSGLALDPEWRMGPHGVPGRRIGSVSAARGEPGLGLARRGSPPRERPAREGVPAAPVPPRHGPAPRGRVAPRANLALVQHVDGFGTPRQKLAHLPRTSPGRDRFRARLQALLRRGRPPDAAPRRCWRSARGSRFVSFQ